MAEIYKNFIDGTWRQALSGKTFENRNPANPSEIVGILPESGTEDIHHAVKAARQAFDEWRLTPPPRRGDIILRAYHLLIERKEELARLATREMGKTLKETRGDVQEGIDTALYMAGEGRRLFGETTTSELHNKFAMSVRMPIGVCGLITPWNFPMAIPTWKIFPALICGNTVVLKPSSEAGCTAAKLVEILDQAGVPKGVVNLVYGMNPECGASLVAHPDVDLISFTGSTATGRKIAESCGKGLKRLSLEMGGKNAQVVMDDANIDLAVEGALWGAFGTTGQRCTATSRLIVHRSVLNEFTEKLVSGAKKLKLGDGLDETTDVGPLVNQTQWEKVQRYVEIGKNEDKATLVTGGEVYGHPAGGYFFKPTIFTDCHSKMKICQEEIFGPVVTIIPVDRFEAAVTALNDSTYGLSSSIYTSDVNLAFKAMRDFQAGITYINVPTIGAETHLPFGGVKNTGNGHRESGTEVLNTYSEWKSVYVDFSGKLQKAQMDT